MPRHAWPRRTSFGSHTRRTSSASYDHYSVLRTIADGRQLGCLAFTCDTGNVPAMTTLVGPGGQVWPFNKSGRLTSPLGEPDCAPGARESAVEHLLYLGYGVDQTCLAEGQRVVAEIGSGPRIDLLGQQEQLVGYAQNLFEEPQTLVPAAETKEALQQPEGAGQEGALPSR